MPYDPKKAKSLGHYGENEMTRVTEPVTEGPHETQIISLEYKEAANGEYVSLRYKVFGDDDPDNKREFTDFFTLNEENRGFVNDMKRLNTIIVLSGLSLGISLEDLIGQSIGVNVSHRKNKDRVFAQADSYFTARGEAPELDIPF